MSSCTSDALWKHSTATATLRNAAGGAGVRIFLQRLVHADREERPPALAGAGELAAGQRLGLALGRTAEQLVERRRREPALDVLAQRVEIEPASPVVARRMDEVPDPFDVHPGVLAVVLQERDRHARDGRRLHVRVGPLQHREAAHADDGLDLAGLDERHHQRRALGDEHGVAELLRLLLQVLDGAQAALLAQQPELVERRGAAVLHAQALGQQQQALVVGHRGQVLAPRLVAEQHADVVEVAGIDAVRADDLLRARTELVEDERRRDLAPPRSHIGLHLPQHDFALRPGLRNGFLGRAHDCRRHRAR